MSSVTRRPKAFALSAIPLLGRLVTVLEKLAPDAREVLERAGLLGFDAVFTFSGGTALTRHADRGAFRIDVGEGSAGKAFYVKRVGRAHAKHIFEALFAGEVPVSKCRREWEFSRKLEAVGVGAVPGLAFGERRFLFWPLESYIVAAEVGGQRLDERLEEMRISDPTGAEKRALTRLVADTIARVHGVGYFHKDLYAKHVFIGRGADSGRISLIDLQRMTAGSGEAAAVRDLAALNVSVDCRLASRADRLRFLVAYAARRWPGGRERVRRLSRKVFDRSARIGGRSKLKGTQWNRQTTR